MTIVFFYFLVCANSLTIVFFPRPLFSIIISPFVQLTFKWSVGYFTHAKTHRRCATIISIHLAVNFYLVQLFFSLLLLHFIRNHFHCLRLFHSCSLWWFRRNNRRTMELTRSLSIWVCNGLEKIILRQLQPVLINELHSFVVAIDERSALTLGKMVQYCTFVISSVKRHNEQVENKKKHILNNELWGMLSWIWRGRWRVGGIFSLT